MTKNILLSGVGGQGTITAAKMLTFGLMEAGYDVKMSEIHGMSQRGGDVVSQVRYSKEKVFSPVIERVRRHCSFLRADGSFENFGLSETGWRSRGEYGKDSVHDCFDGCRGVCGRCYR